MFFCYGNSEIIIRSDKNQLSPSVEGFRDAASVSVFRLRTAASENGYLRISFDLHLDQDIAIGHKVAVFIKKFDIRKGR